jgi:hypothetical protein
VLVEARAISPFSSILIALESIINDSLKILTIAMIDNWILKLTSLFGCRCGRSSPFVSSLVLVVARQTIPFSSIFLDFDSILLEFGSQFVVLHCQQDLSRALICFADLASHREDFRVVVQQQVT